MSPLTWAVAAVVTDASGRLLLCRRSEGARRWGLPGGRLPHDESPADAVVRAVRAETGWAVAPADLVGLYRVTDPQAPAPPAGRCGGPPDVLVHVFHPPAHAERSRMIDTSSAKWRGPGVHEHASSAYWSRSRAW
ncbi:NUDIX domain-containing protein [Micromonospora aurantiaca]|uniref:NUDIX hydrolase n=1 Tax=Micromonospora aurantiaca (nom. illeg.) TaxID=47850 RepID=UPI0034519C0F